MRIRWIHVEGFRSLANVRVELDRLTALIGANGTGKSSFLRALEFFFGQLNPDADDLHRGSQQAEAIEVSLCFDELPDDLRQKLGPYLEGDGTLVVTRRWEREGKSVYLATARRIAEFAGVRQAGSAVEAKRAYEHLLGSYPALPGWASRDQALEALNSHEAQHREACQELQEANVVGIGKGLQVDLSRWIKLLAIPAVKEATDEAAEPRGNLFSELVKEHAAVPRVAAGMDELRRDTSQRYRELLDAHAREELQRASQDLTKRLQRFVPGATVELTWDTRDEPKVPEPRIAVQLAEREGILNWVGRQGHGVQRAFLLTLLTAIAEGRPPEGDQPQEPRPSVVLAIEEPELYQHPPQAKLLARTLADLAMRERSRFQVVYTTHSPLFVSMDRVEQLRLLRVSDGSTQVARLDRPSLEAELKRLGRRGGLDRQLRLLTETSLAEGFFARRVVLLEGDEDRAYLLAAAASQSVDLAGLDISVIPAEGKANLLVPLLVLQKLGIPVFVVFDTDSDKTRPGERERVARENEELLAALGEPEEEFPATKVCGRGAWFDPNIGAVVGTDLGHKEFARALEEAVEEVGGGDAKNPLVLRQALRRLSERGMQSTTLASLITVLKDWAGEGSAGSRAAGSRGGVPGLSVEDSRSSGQAWRGSQ